MATKTNVRDVAADLIGGTTKPLTRAQVLAKVRNAKSPAQRAAEAAAAKAAAAKGTKPAAAKGKGTKSASASNRQTYADNAKITFIGNFEPRSGARTEKMFKALKASKTVGQFRAAREKMNLSGVGKLFARLLGKKVIKVSA